MCVRVRMTSWDIVSSGLDKGPVGTHIEIIVIHTYARHAFRPADILPTLCGRQKLLFKHYLG